MGGEEKWGLLSLKIWLVFGRRVWRGVGVNSFINSGVKRYLVCI